MPGGQLELIHDDMCFSYHGPHPPREEHPSPLSLSPRKPSTPVPTHALGESFLDTDPYESTESLVPDPEPARNSFSSDDVDTLPSYTESTTGRVAEWTRKAHDSWELENVFREMLHARHISERPQERFERAIDTTFGRRHSEFVTTLHLALAPPDVENELDDGTVKTKTKRRKALKNWLNANVSNQRDSMLWHRTSELNLQAAVADVPSNLNAKAAERLGIVAPRSSTSEFNPPSAAADIPSNLNAKAAERLGIVVPRSSITDDEDGKHPKRHSEESLNLGPRTPPKVNSKAMDRLGTRPSSESEPATQSPGLILWPNIFIPMAPYELEGHACKHVQTLLGCKSAMFDHLRAQRMPEGKERISRAEFEDIIFSYECFRRGRFNWPETLPELSMNSRATFASSDSKLSFATRSCHQYRRDDLTFVRAIHVYNATKIDDEVPFPSASIVRS